MAILMSPLLDRWDTPQHVLVDDPEGDQETPKIWPGRCPCHAPEINYLTHKLIGKDYSNPRIIDFHTLNKPDDDMYDRSKVPRMPWYLVLPSLNVSFSSMILQARCGYADCWTASA
jgi:hypothetical protein